MTYRTPRMGANSTPEGTTFRVWAPKARTVELTSDVTGTIGMVRDGDEFSTTVPNLAPGTLYRYLVDGRTAVPDPYARSLPQGVHGPSEVIDPNAFAWSDANWPGLSMNRLSVYELHVGTYTAGGTFASLRAELPTLRHLGVSAIELMPIHAFPGDRSWGYDGVGLFAPSARYGTPDDLRRLVDAAHNQGIGVILDVVYNHLGPEGNYLGALSDQYFTDTHSTPWGDAINYDGPGSRYVRDWAIDNACQWISEYHFDGLRLDAADTLRDDSDLHLMAELSDRVRAITEKPVLLFAEEAWNDVKTAHPRTEGGHGFDAVWADDFHHSVRVHLTGTQEHYYQDYSGAMPELCRGINDGFIYQGEPSTYSGEPRGTLVMDEPASAFLFCIQNHDQVGNRPFGERLHHEVSAERYAVASTLLLFLPQPALIFMGQEFAATTPFLFFSDLGDDLGEAVTEGRRNEFAGFRAFSDPAMKRSIPDPQAEETFKASKVDLLERIMNSGMYTLYRELLALRRDDLCLGGLDRGDLHAEPRGSHMLTVSRVSGDDHRLLVANFGAAAVLDDLAIIDASLILTTTDTRFGGIGAQPTVASAGNYTRVSIPARSALILGGRVVD